MPLHRPDPVAPTGERVVLHVGCVMDAWQRTVHQAAVDLLAAVGVEVVLPGSQPCCGALHHHAGVDDSRQRARTVATYDIDDLPVVVDSAGCGAAMREYDDPTGFAGRVVDIHTYLADRSDRLPDLRHQGSVVLQDPCHLRHVQRAHDAVAHLLGRCADVRTIPDDGLCCGAGGSFALQQPALAAEVRARKLAAIERAIGGEDAVVASANPGCIVHLSVGSRAVYHPLEILAGALPASTDGDGPRRSPVRRRRGWRDSALLSRPSR